MFWIQDTHAKCYILVNQMQKGLESFEDASHSLLFS